MVRMAWICRPVAPPGCQNRASWFCDASHLVAVRALNVGWCLVDPRDPRPHIVIDGHKLTYERVFNGSWAMSASGGHTFARHPGLGWVFQTRSSSIWNTPRAWLDYDGSTVLGDDYWSLPSDIGSPDDIPGRIPFGGSLTIELTGHGPNAGGTTLTGTWKWPRLEPASRRTAANAFPGSYNCPRDGFGAATVVLGNNVFMAGENEYEVAADGLSCGPARLSGGNWGFDDQEDIRLIADRDLRTCLAGETVNWLPGGEGDPADTWRCVGARADGTARIWAGDVARWL